MDDEMDGMDEMDDRQLATGNGQLTTDNSAA
jgi:hypothetical protein